MHPSPGQWLAPVAALSQSSAHSADATHMPHCQVAPEMISYGTCMACSHHWLASPAHTQSAVQRCTSSCVVMVHGPEPLADCYIPSATKGHLLHELGFLKPTPPLAAPTAPSCSYPSWHQQRAGCLELVVQHRLHQVLARALAGVARALI